MAYYVVKRILLVVLTVLAVIFVLFVLLYALPASPVRALPVSNGGDALDRLFAFFHAGDTIVTKYVRYCYQTLVRFDFRWPANTSSWVLRDIPNRTRATLTMLAGGAGATLAVGIPLGAYAAIHKNRRRDRIINITTLLLSSIPSYALAMVVALIFVVQLRVLPIVSRPLFPRAYIMPTLTIALGGVSLITRTMRASMLEVLELPFISALRARGLKETRVLCLHAFRNALTPVVSVMGGFIAQMLCWTFVVESFFTIPGLGLHILRAVSTRDYLGTLGCSVVISIILAVTNIAADILYACIDPQIRQRYAVAKRGRSTRERRAEG